MGLISTTVVPPKAGSGGTHATFGPGDEVPAWAAAHMGVHLFENEEHPFPDGDYPGKPAVSAESVAHPDTDERKPGSIPPKAGKGSSRDAWAAYANDVDVEIPPDAQRDSIIEAISAAGKPVEYVD